MVDATSATATFLFTDIEGSTQLLTRLRERYAELLAEHHRLLRRIFDEHHGQEIDNQGDSFFVAFPRTRDAVSAAAEIQRALAQHEWPDGVELRVRIGLHTGEAHSTGERYIGLSVNRAARISAVGHGGQVLVSQTTANHVEDDIEHLDGLSLKDLGERQLKDIARPVRIYQLDVDGLPKQFPPLKAPRPERRRRSRRMALLAAPLVAVGIAAGLFLLLGSDSAAPTVVPDSLVRYDPDTLEPTDVIKVGAAPDLVVAAGHYVWVTHYVIGPNDIRQAGDHNLTRVDTRTSEAVVVGGGLSPCGLAADPSGDVWVANCYGPSRPGTLVRVGADDLRFKATFSIPAASAAARPLVYGGGSLWTSDVDGSDPTLVDQIDPRTGKRRRFDMSYPTEPSAWSDGYGDLWGLQVDTQRLARFHPATSSTKTIDPGVTSLGDVAVAADVVWVADWSTPRVARLQARGAPRSRVIDLPTAGAPDPDTFNGVLFVEAVEGAVWATVPGAGQLWRIDPDTNASTKIDVPYFPAGVAVGRDAVWVTVRDETV